MFTAALSEVHRTLVANGLNPDRSYTSGHKYSGPLAVGGRTVEIAFTFDDLEFVRLPILTLVDPTRDCPEVVAHLARDNEFCFARKEQVLLDRYQPGGSILECIRLAREGIERALTRKDQRADIALEFPQHWLGQTIALLDYRQNVSGTAWIYSVPRSRGSQMTLLADNEQALEAFGLSPTELAFAKHARQPAFVYRTDRNLSFDHGVRQPATLTEFLAWTDTVDANLSSILLERAAATYPNVSALFVYGKNGCVGIDVQLSILPTNLQRIEGLLKYLKTQAAVLSIVRIECSRTDPEFILSRNLNGVPTLAGKRIALIGCGTIGSHLAKLLVQSGAGWSDGCLILIDREALVPGNIGRHFLGSRYIGENKAAAMRQELLRVYPEHTILAQPFDAIRQFVQLEAADLVIDASGEEALSRSINDYFISKRERGAAPDVLHVWLIGNGDAAQALLVRSAEHACYKCLRLGHDGPWRFNPLLPEHKAELVFGPCGEGMFMAYGVGAPVIAAGLGLQMALDWMKGGGTPYFRTICIDTRRTRSIKNKNVRRQDGCLACDTSLRSAASPNAKAIPP